MQHEGSAPADVGLPRSNVSRPQVGKAANRFLCLQLPDHELAHPPAPLVWPPCLGFASLGFHASVPRYLVSSNCSYSCLAFFVHRPRLEEALDNLPLCIPDGPQVSFAPLLHAPEQSTGSSSHATDFTSSAHRTGPASRRGPARLA